MLNLQNDDDMAIYVSCCCYTRIQSDTLRITLVQLFSLIISFNVSFIDGSFIIGNLPPEKENVLLRT